MIARASWMHWLAMAFAAVPFAVGREPVEQGAGRADCSPGDLRSYATIQSIGMEWDLVGDADHDADCNVQYRAQDAGTWKEALPLFRVDYRWHYNFEQGERRLNMLAGSILFLEPDTTYEIRLELTDPDGGTANRLITVRTRPVPRIPEGGRSWHVVPGSGGGQGTEANPFQGIAAAQAAAQPADVCLLHGGDYGSATFDKSGQPGKYLVWKAAGDGDAVFEAIDVAASHLWLEGLTLRRRDRSNGLKAQGAAEDVVVCRNCFTGFHYSIFLSNTSRAWHIADNVIEGDNDPMLSGRAGISGEGVELNHSGGHVVAYNRISRVADGISYPERNCDLHNNDIFDVSDDGLEPDRGYANVRMWENRIYNYKNNALSFQPMRCGPWYFVRNQVIGRGAIFKFRVQDRFLLAHNTFVRWGGVGNRMHHILTSLSRNNLYISAGGDEPVWTAIDCRQPQFCLLNVYQPYWKTDVDHDGFDWGQAAVAFRWNNKDRYPDLESFAKAVGIERHGIRVRKEEIFEQYDVPAQPGPVRPQVLTLKPECGAVDAGDLLPNINDGFTGKAPDLGAHEVGKPQPHYGPRDPVAGRSGTEVAPGGISW